MPSADLDAAVATAVTAPVIDRILARVGRILLEGGIVAAPNAQAFNLILNRTDTPERRESVCNTGQFVQLNRDPYEIKVDGRRLPIGPVYVLHPEAFTENATEAIEALEAGNAEGFHLRIKAVNPRGEDWCQQHLVVRVAPPIILRLKSKRDLVWHYYKEAELTPDAARIANRIIQLAIPSEIGRRCSMFVAASCIAWVRVCPRVSMRC
jgi:hypothetical protein